MSYLPFSLKSINFWANEAVSSELTVTTNMWHSKTREKSEKEISETGTSKGFATTEEWAIATRCCPTVASTELLEYRIKNTSQYPVKARLPPRNNPNDLLSFELLSESEKITATLGLTIAIYLISMKTILILI